MTTSGSVAALSVPRWTDLLSGLQQRHPGACISLGNLESRLLSERLGTISIEKPIYIAGLARSGTTILLELLARHPQLASHRYRDFPPILTPWFWNWFVDRAAGGEQQASERAHGDGIDVSAESPEAFEEVIWMAFFAKLHDPAVNAVLNADTRNEAFETFYRDHIRKLLLLRGGQRYLSKANYNLTRLAYLHKLFPDARFVLPVRDPVWHIASLQQQHARFCREHQRDARLQRHMSRSGHFEFGLDRRPVNSGDPATTRSILECWAADRETEGWALYWQDLYGGVADQLTRDHGLRRATLIVDYDSLCRDPGATISRVLKHCSLPSDDIDLAAEAARTIRAPTYYRPAFSEQQIVSIKQITGPAKRQFDALATEQNQPARHPRWTIAKC